ncbi:MAG: Ig-like domain-containing protein, partial [Candidatus Helarchaeota archaeon]
PEIRANYGDLVTFSGRLTDDDLVSMPLSDKLLSFSLENSASTWIPLGDAYTSADGWAYITWGISFPPGGYNSRVDFNGDAHYNPFSQITSPGLVVERETILLSNPSKSIYQGQPDTLATVVTDDEYNPIEGIEVDFFISGSSWTYLGTSTSDVNGIASITTTINLPINTYDLKVFVSESAYYKSAILIGSVTIRPPLQATSVTLLGGPYVAMAKYPYEYITLQALLTDGTTPIYDKIIKFYYSVPGSGTWTYMGYSWTGFDGVAMLHIPASAAVGEYDIKAVFEGDADYSLGEDINLASSKQGYAVISEYAFAPWFERLTNTRHYTHDQAVAELGLPEEDPLLGGLLTKYVFHWYLCKWVSEFYFNWETYYYYKYYYWKDNIPDRPDKSDPGYVHEFRSYPPHVLEARLREIPIFPFGKYIQYAYYHNLPGDTGITDSGLFEEWYDGYEEVEFYTRNPDLLQKNYWYQAGLIYKVETLDAGHIVSEAELVEEAWWLYFPYGALSPPGYPMRWLVLTSRINFPAHSDNSWSGFRWAWDPPINSSVNVIEYHPYRKTLISGIAPAIGRVDISFEIDSFSEVLNYIDLQRNELRKFNLENPNEEIYASITFKNLVPLSEVRRIIHSYNLKAFLYRYESEEDGVNFKGQLVSFEPNGIHGDLLGIYRMDVCGTTTNLYRLQNENATVLLVDISYSQMNLRYQDKWFENFSITLDDFYYYYKKFHGLQNISLFLVDVSSDNVSQPMKIIMIISLFSLVAVAIRLTDKRPKLPFDSLRQAWKEELIKNE